MEKRVFKVILVLFMLICLPFAARAEVSDSGMFGADGNNLTWIYDDTGVLTISGMGQMENLYADIPWNEYRSEINKVVIQNGVTNIGAKAFYSMSALESIMIPESVTEIENYAFSNCSSLAAVDLPVNLEKIGDGAFEHCAITGEVNIPSEVLHIGAFAFYECEGLKSVTLQEGVEYISIGAFEACDSLEEITIPGSVDYISSYAFAECTELDSVTILRGRKNLSIQESAFEGCELLRSVTIPGNVSLIKPAAFAKCYNLSEITLDDDVTCINKNTFKDSAYYKDNENWTDGVLYIGKHLIEAHSDEVSGEYVVKPGTTTISSGAFMNCTGLSSIAVPSSIIQINGGVFDGCDKISDLYYEGTQAQWESIVIFDNFDGITIHYLADEQIEVQIGVTNKDDSRIFTVSTANPRPYSRVYIAVYDANDTVTKIGTVELNMDCDTIMELTKTNTDVSAKIFLWDSIMCPLCDAVLVDF